MTPLASVEVFHLIFLNHLGSRVSRNLFALKGGCNLRFFHKSIRFSEDLDLDVHTLARDTLKKQVSSLFDAAPFKQMLQTRGITLLEWSAPKQTDTVQRWKVSLQAPGSDVPIPTKIEFSRRPAAEPAQVEPIDSDLIRTYGLYPILCSHYAREIAFRQKVLALMQRAETQARDVFDLEHLLRGSLHPKSPKDCGRQELAKAQENALSMSAEDFRSQVVAYLPPEFQEHYSRPEVWDALVAKVVDALEAMKSEDRDGAS